MRTSSRIAATVFKREGIILLHPFMVGNAAPAFPVLSRVLVDIGLFPQGRRQPRPCTGLVMTSTRGGGLKTLNRSKRIEFSPPEGGQPLPRPGAKDGARRNPKAGFVSWVGRNLCRRNLPGSGFVVPLLGLKGASACLSRKPGGILCRTFRPPRLSARTVLVPGPQHKWEHGKFHGNVKLF